MVEAVRAGRSQRGVARELGVRLGTVQYWVGRAGGERLDDVDWADRLRGARRAANRTDGATEDMVLSVRQYLSEYSALGEWGAEAIRRELVERAEASVPSVRTIGRILDRSGVLDGRRRLRRPAPPRGWYVPEVARGEAELDAFDTIEGLVIEGGRSVEVLTGMSLHGGLPAAWPEGQISAKNAVQRLVWHWREFGLPAYAQFDNDTVFQGAHQFPDTVGRVARLCLALEVVPIFTVPREHGFQNPLESFNGRWQAKVWRRWHYGSRTELRRRSVAYIGALRTRSAARIDAAPDRRAFPDPWRLNLKAPLHGRILYLRRTDDRGCLDMLGHRFPVDPQWPGRLVRAELDLDAGLIRLFALRRRDPTHQPLLKEIAHVLPNRPFRG